MADSSIGVTLGTGALVDTRTVAGGDHQQAIVIGNGTDATIAAVDASGLHVHAGKTATAPTPFRLSDTTVAASLLNSNANRLGVVIHNDSDAILYVRYGSGASSTSYHYKLLSQVVLSLPEPGQPVITSQITGVWSADTASGAANYFEVT